MQSDLILPNVTGPEVREYLNWFAEAIVTQQSGGTEPPNPRPFQWWADTTTGLLKQRNASNNAWVVIGGLDATNFGLATLAANTFTGAQNFNGHTLQRPVLLDYSEALQDLGTISGSVAISTAAGNVAAANIGGDTTFSFATSWPAGVASSLTLWLTNGGAHSIAWPTGSKWPSGLPPALTAMGLDIVTLTTLDGGATWFGVQATPRAVTTFPKVLDVTPSSFASATTSHAVAMPASVAPGQLLLAKVSLRRPVGTLGSVTTPDGWTLLASGGSVSFRGWYARKADGTEGGTTVDFESSTATTGAAQVHRVDKWFGDIAAGVHLGASTTGTSSTPNAGVATAPWGKAKNLFITSALCNDGDEGLISYPDDYGDGVTTISGAWPSLPGAAVYSARRQLEAASDNAGAFTLDAADFWDARTLIVRPR